MSFIGERTIIRNIPARKEKIKILWCSTEWMPYKTFKDARNRYNQNVQKRCWFCKESFKDDDMLAIAGILGKSNKLLCSCCVKKIEENPPDHCCGLQGFDPMLGDTCPRCDYDREKRMRKD